MCKISYSELGKKHFKEYPIKGVLFDMDGVLIDTEKLYTKFWVEAGRLLGYPMELEHALQLRSLNHVIAQELFESWFGPKASIDEVRRKRVQLMNAHIKEKGVELKPGVEEILDILDEKNIPYCIATASPKERIVEYLTFVGIAHRFQHYVTAYDVKKGKPEPDIYLAAAKIIGVKPENCIAVEDSYNGLLAAYRAGTAPVMVPDQDQPNEKIWQIIAAKADSLSCMKELFDNGTNVRLVN